MLEVGQRVVPTSTTTRMLIALVTRDKRRAAKAVWLIKLSRKLSCWRAFISRASMGKQIKTTYSPVAAEPSRLPTGLLNPTFAGIFRIIQILVELARDRHRLPVPVPPGMTYGEMDSAPLTVLKP